MKSSELTTFGRFRRLSSPNQRGEYSHARLFSKVDFWSRQLNTASWPWLHSTDIGGTTDATCVPRFQSADQVALGRYLPRAPTDPYVPALEHTVPQVMASLRV